MSGSTEYLPVALEGKMPHNYLFKMQVAETVSEESVSGLGVMPRNKQFNNFPR